VLWFDQVEQAHFLRRMGRTLILSLVVHLIILLIVTILRLPQRGERPLAAVEVSLVNMSTPTPVPVKQPDILKTPVPPTPPPPKSVPVPVVKEAAPVRAAVAPVGHTARDVLRDLQLPPDAPKFGELAPTKSVAAPQQEAKIKVPELPRIPDPIQEPVAHKIPSRAALSEDVDRELEEELKKVKQFTPAPKLEVLKRDTKPVDEPAKPAPQQEAKVATAKTPDTTLTIAGSSGSNPYWARVQNLISSQWEPKAVFLTGVTYTVTIRFRLQRDGSIKDVTVLRSSGNGYFDDAGQRAVLDRHLPPFPADITESYKDVEMVFRVGEPAG
jgi:TonB family protein